MAIIGDHIVTYREDFVICYDYKLWRPHASWLRQLESYLKDTGTAGLASASAMATRRPKEYRRKMDAATAYAAIPDLT